MFSNRAIWILILVLFITEVQAQVSLSFDKDSIQLLENKSFINFLKIENNLTEQIEVTEILPVEDYPGILLLPSSNFKIEPNEKKNLPFKFIANLDLLQSEFNTLDFEIYYSIRGETLKKRLSFEVFRKEENKIYLIKQQPVYYIRTEDRELKASFYIENKGYTSQSLQLAVEESSADFWVDPAYQQVVLAPQERKLIEVNVYRSSSKMNYSSYQLEVRALKSEHNGEEVSSRNSSKVQKRDSKNILAFTYLKLLNLSSATQMTPTATGIRNNNFTELAYATDDRGVDYSQLRGHGLFSLGHNFSLEANLVSDYYLQQEQFNLYDTWIELKGKSSTYRVGSIYGNDYDQSVSGKGLMFGKRFKNGDDLELFGIDRNYSLYNSRYSTSKNAKMLGGKYTLKRNKSHLLTLSSIFEDDPRMRTMKQLNRFNSSFVIDSIHHFDTGIGLSYERGSILKDENYGFNFKANYLTNLKKWSFVFQNSFSSPTYAGLSRGSYNFNEKVSYRIGKGDIFFQYQKNQVNPRNLGIQDRDFLGAVNAYKFSSQSAKLGLQLFARRVNILFYPELVRQTNEMTLNKQSMSALRFRTTIGTRFSNTHSLLLTADYSLIKNVADLKNPKGLKTTFSYFLYGFSLGGTLQYNPYDVNELNFINTENEGFINYNIFSSYRFQLNNPNLKASISAGFGDSQLFKSRNLNFNTNIEYGINPYFAATLNADYYEYSNQNIGGFKNRNYRIKVGIKKYFKSLTESGKYTLKMKLFQDDNFNGEFDSGEIPVTNQIVELDKHIAVTDSKGEVTFHNVPKGIYTLKLSASDGMRININPVLKVDKNLKIQVPLVKKVKLTGKLIEIKQNYDRKETSPRGIKVYAKDNLGEIKETLVNQNNQFEFYLDPGEYEIYIKNDQFRFLIPSQKIRVYKDKEERQPSVLFEYEKKDLEIKVKKF